MFSLSLIRNKKIYIVLGFLALSFILILYGGTQGLFRNQYDDSYITYRYAINLASGEGFVFNQNEKADAASSFLYTVILALLYRIGITNLEFVATVLGLLAVLGITFFVYESVSYFTRNKILSFLLSLLTAFHGFISGWSISGMETVLFTFFVTGFVYFYYFTDKRRYILSTLFLSAVILTRIEGVILVFAWFVNEIYSLYKYNHFRSRFYISLVVLGLLFIGLYGWKYWYYGSFISNAVDFKKIATYYQPNVIHLLLAWGGTSLLIVLCALFSVSKISLKKYWSLLLYLFLSIITFAVGPHSDGARYSIHIFPIIVVLAGRGFMDLPSKVNILSLEVPAKHIILMAIIFQTILSAFVLRYYMNRLMAGQMCRREIGKYLSENLSKYDYILASDVGMISYIASNIEIIDIAGLTSKDVLKSYKKKETIDQIILEKKPRVIADTFAFVNGEYIHPILQNKTEYIEGMMVYSNLFQKQSFTQPRFICRDNERAYAVFSLEHLYGDKE